MSRKIEAEARRRSSAANHALVELTKKRTEVLEMQEDAKREAEEAESRMVELKKREEETKEREQKLYLMYKKMELKKEQQAEEDRCGEHFARGHTERSSLECQLCRQFHVTCRNTLEYRRGIGYAGTRTPAVPVRQGWLESHIDAYSLILLYEPDFRFCIRYQAVQISLFVPSRL